jgi:trehalose 6-phosphate phosphatase
VTDRGSGTWGCTSFRRSANGQVWVDPRLEAARPAVLAAQQDLRDWDAVRDIGAYRQDKEYSVAMHTRRVPDPPRWAEPIDRAARQIADRHGLEVVLGKLVWELRPAVRSDKGDAVRRSWPSPVPARWSWLATTSATCPRSRRQPS